jgi:hypothetical protein
MHKDIADLFAAEGEAAREVIRELKERAVDALHLELSEAPKGSNSLGRTGPPKSAYCPSC